MLHPPLYALEELRSRRREDPLRGQPPALCNMKADEDHNRIVNETTSDLPHASDNQPSPDLTPGRQSEKHSQSTLKALRTDRPVDFNHLHDIAIKRYMKTFGSAHLPVICTNTNET